MTAALPSPSRSATCGWATWCWSARRPVPADGEIVDGAAELDESMITGESRPVAKATGDHVVAGTVSTDSAIRMRITAVGDTALAGIQRLVAEAQASSSRAQVLADRFAALLFYVATAAGIVTFLVWAELDLELGDAHGDRPGHRPALSASPSRW